MSNFDLNKGGKKIDLVKRNNNETHEKTEQPKVDISKSSPSRTIPPSPYASSTPKNVSQPKPSYSRNTGNSAPQQTQYSERSDQQYAAPPSPYASNNYQSPRQQSSYGGGNMNYQQQPQSYDRYPQNNNIQRISVDSSASGRTASNPVPMLIVIVILLLIILSVIIGVMMSAPKSRKGVTDSITESVVTEPIKQTERITQQEQYNEYEYYEQNEENANPVITESPMATVYETEPYYTKRTGKQQDVATTVTSTTIPPTSELAVQYQRINFLSDIDRITSSSNLASQTYDGVAYDYSPERTVDSDLKTCWCEGNSEYGIGETITYYFRDIRLVDRIDVWNGLCTSEDLFYKNSRLKNITIVFSYGQKFDYEFLDGWENRENSITLPQTVATSSMMIIINDVYKGDKYKDTCISEVNIS